MKVKSEADEKKRQELYSAYLENLDKELDYINQKQTEQLIAQNISAFDEANRMLTNSRSLWNRRPEHSDFLDIRVGTGDIPVQANITFPQEQIDLTGNDDPMIEKLNEVKNKPRILKDVPIMLQLSQYYSIGISGEPYLTDSFVCQMLIQLALHIGYDELKLCIIGKLPPSLEKLAWLPHNWDDQKNVHYFARNKDELGKILPVFDSVLRDHRADGNRTFDNDTIKKVVVFLITDPSLAQSGMVTRLLFEKKYNKVHVISVAEHSRNLPRRIDMAIGLKPEQGRMLWQENNDRTTIDFHSDPSVLPQLNELVSIMANTRLDLQEEMYTIPDMISFLSMFNVNNVAHLNIIARWRSSDPMHTLAAPIGLCEDGNTCFLDLHEKSDGPHGLVAGTTGSGKSEMLMNYILSMAVCYSPQELSFVLIDYKGGGMAKAFENLPHTAGIITNLDGNEINRSLLSIQSELERRQRVFAETQEKVGSRNIDIYKYQKYFRDGKVDQPMSHLVMITDEFAELKTQEPEFLQQLIRAARIGRSLGVHLILATQKPAGVVDDQIWSNSNFHICLRVQDTRDSQDVLKCEDAAHLTKSGSMYKQVGYGEVLIKAQSGYTGADYEPDSVSLPSCGIDVLDHMGNVIRHEEMSLKTKKAASAQLEAVTDYIISTCKRSNLKADKLWLPPLEEVIMLSDLAKKYKVTHTPWIIEPILGEYDDPSNQKRELIRIDVTSGKNTVIYGTAGSGKIMLLTTLLEDMMTHHTPDELNLYLIDAADDGLGIYKDAPHVGDVIGSTEDEKIVRLLIRIEDEIKLRKKTLGGSMMGDSLADRLRKAEMPNIVVIIHHILMFQNLTENLEERFKAIYTEGPRYGIFFLITQERGAGLHFQVAQLFAQKYVLQMDSDDDYMMVFGRTNGFKPMPIKGRGIIKEETIYEFQTATADQNPVELSAKLKAEWKGKRVDSIRILPDRVEFEDLEEYVNKDKPWCLPVGLNLTTIVPEFYDVSNKSVSCVLGSSDYVDDFIIGYERLAVLAGLKTVIMNEREAGKIIDELFEFCKEYKMRKDAGNPIEDVTQTLIIIPDLKLVQDNVDATQWEKVEAMLGKGSLEWGYRFIIAGSPDGLSKYQYSEWFSNVPKNFGIFLGEGFGNQYILQTEKFINEAIEYPIGYMVKNKKAIKIKFIQSVEEGVI